MKPQKSQAKKCPRKLGSNLKIWRIYLEQANLVSIDIPAKTKREAISRAKDIDIGEFRPVGATNRIKEAVMLRTVS